MIRRLSLDLIGLPPIAGEVREFVEDTRPDAYERLADRLLDRPEYASTGRRRGSTSRVMPTRTVTRRPPANHLLWRDWVIRAINDDMLLDQFTVEQIAGDMLPGATLSQKYWFSSQHDGQRGGRY